MRHWTLLTALQLLLLMWVTAQARAADTPTLEGGELLRRCTSALQTRPTGAGDLDTQTEASWCLGYVLGFTAGRTAEHINSTLPSPMLCPPDRWPPAWQLSRSLVTWLQAHPTDLQLDHSTIMLLAYASVFPCSVDDLTPPQLPPPAAVLQRLPTPKARKGKP